MKKAIFIVGPTATGKTDLAFYLAKKIPLAPIRSGVILVSADSIQVYRGADIISGKDNSIHTELLDVVNPAESFSMSDYVTKVREIIERKNAKIPIIVGGTGLYINALFKRIDTISVPRNEKLREKLEKLSVSDLQYRLKKINPTRLSSMNSSDLNNKRRLVRAIEIGGRSNNVIPVFEESECLFIGLKASLSALRKRIKKRVQKRIKMGALDEAKTLFKDYKNLSSQIKDANGYRELFDYFLEKTDLEEAKEKWITADYHHAKNQMTWFRKNKNIHWFDIEEKDIEHKILRLISSELNL